MRRVHHSDLFVLAVLTGRYFFLIFCRDIVDIFRFMFILFYKHFIDLYRSYSKSLRYFGSSPVYQNIIYYTMHAKYLHCCFYSWGPGIPYPHKVLGRFWQIYHQNITERKKGRKKERKKFKKKNEERKIFEQKYP